MYKKLLIIAFLLSSISSAKTVKTKDMKANNYTKHYNNSSNIESTEDKIISSTAEVSAQITISIAFQVTTEMTSGRYSGTASISFLDHNRMQITEEMAKGKGEHIETLLAMMKLKNDKKSLENIQKHFNELIYLSHNNFLEKLEELS